MSLLSRCHPLYKQAWGRSASGCKGSGTLEREGSPTTITPTLGLSPLEQKCTRPCAGKDSGLCPDLETALTFLSLSPLLLMGSRRGWGVSPGPRPRGGARLPAWA